MLVMRAVPMLAGCDTKSGPFRQVDGGWRYKDTAIPDADARTFAALDDHCANDRLCVYHADTCRECKEYFLIAHDTITAVAGAHAASFAVLAFDDATGSTHVHYRGAVVPGADAATFTTLDAPTDAGDARDAKRTYAQGRPVRVR